MYVAPFRAPLIEAINLNPIFINYVLFSAIKVDNSSIEYYFDCGSAETIETTETTEIEAPSTTVRLLNTASTHTPTYVLNVIWASLVLQLLIRIRWTKLILNANVFEPILSRIKGKPYLLCFIRPVCVRACVCVLVVGASAIHIASSCIMVHCNPVVR